MAKGFVALISLLFATLIFVAVSLFVTHVAAVFLSNEVVQALISALVGVWLAVKVVGLKINFN